MTSEFEICLFCQRSLSDVSLTDVGGGLHLEKNHLTRQGRSSPWMRRERTHNSGSESAVVTGAVSSVSNLRLFIFLYLVVKQLRICVCQDSFISHGMTTLP